MRIIFRVDSSQAIGVGHVARVSVLAGMLMEHDAEIWVICTLETVPVLQRFLPNASFHVIETTVNELQDASLTAGAIEHLNIKPDWLIVDHYALGKIWESTLYPYTERLMVIDDLARIHQCDLLLDQNCVAGYLQRYQGKVSDSCETLLGAEYALLRPKFSYYRRQRTFPRTPPERLFVCFGGSDPDNMTAISLDAVDRSSLGNMTVDIVVGPGYHRLSELIQRSENRPNWYIHKDIADPERLMAQADIAIGAGGTMTWERCALGVPSLVVSIADNQVETCKYLHKEKILHYMGRAPAVSMQEMLSAIERFAASRSALAQLSENGFRLVDAKGIERVGSKLYAMSTEQS